MISEVGTTSATSLGSATTLPPAPGGKLGKEEFLKMLVAQLRHQDPLNPMKGDDMAAQLAQFSSLEQLTNIGKALENQASMQEGLIASIHDTTAMDVLGKSVLAAGDQVYVPGDGTGSVQFDVGGTGGLATLKIFDERGQQVGARELGFVSAGRHEYDIAGAADGLQAGGYTYAVDVKDAAGKAVPSQTLIGAIVDGVNYGPDGPVLTSGPLRIPFATILKISVG